MIIVFKFNVIEVFWHDVMVILMGSFIIETEFLIACLRFIVLFIRRTEIFFIRYYSSDMQDSTADHFVGAADTRRDNFKLHVSLMQQQLSLLLHAGRCKRLLDNGKPNNCTDQNCKKTQSLLLHIEKCSFEKDCSTAHCFSFKILLRHFRDCTTHPCPLCNAVRRFSTEARHSGSSALSETSNGCIVSPTSDAPVLNGVKFSSSPDNCNNARSTADSSVTPNAMMNGEFLRTAKFGAERDKAVKKL